ncbi:MAG: cobaltochelatase subunit CobN, partial [archaeon]|nr:cobaltochelatase subunit CobN [archaeon]
MKMKLVFVSVQTADARTLALPSERLRDIGIEPEVFAINSDDVDDDVLQLQELLRRTKDADFVFLRCMSDTARFKRFNKFESVLGECKGLTLLYSGNAEVSLMYRDRFKGTDAEYAEIARYAASRGPENDYGMLRWVAKKLGITDLEPPEPIVQRTDGIYHKGMDRDITLDDYLKTLDPSRPTVGIMFASTLWVYDNLAHIDVLTETLERKGMNTIPMFYSAISYSVKDSEGTKKFVRKYFTKDGKSLVDVLIVVTSFSVLSTSRTEMGVGTIDSENFYRHMLNVPVIHALTVTGEYADFETDKIGLGKHDITASVAFPEIDGNIIGYPITYTPRKSGKKKAIPIVDRIERISELAYNWAKLRYIPPSERKVAILMWQSRPDSGCIGNAAGLDTLESVSEILKKLDSKGYIVDNVPSCGKELTEEILDNVTNDLDSMSIETVRKKAAALMDRKEYLEFYKDIPEWDRGMTEKDWGTPPGELMVDRDKIIVPGIVKGNVFVGFQPLRGLAD